MPGLGTLINAGLIVIGGIAGLLVGKGLKDRLQQTLMCALGISIIILALGGVLSEMLVIEDDALTTQGTMMMIFSMALGAITGELIDLERHLEQFGIWLKKKTGNAGDSGFTAAFVDASLTVCIGAMAVMGAIQDGIYHDYSILLTKGILDAVIILVMASSRGKGAVFSAIPVFIFQGCITFLAKLLEPVMTAQALSNLSLVGSILIFCVGINLTFGKKIKVANLLPSIVFAVIFAFVPWF